MSDQQLTTFELLKSRLAKAALDLRARADALNVQRLERYPRADLKLLARYNARTENNAHARDLVRVGHMFLFGFQVQMGLKRETQVEDVFTLYELAGEHADELKLVEQAGSFLADARFGNDFRELFTYYRATTLDQLRIIDDKLLMIFKTGIQASDKRVFRFALDRAGNATYIDSRGDRDHVLPHTHDFEWSVATRDRHVPGRHPHINIDDAVFVETISGDLTIKVENNTESGLGIYSESVEDKNQSLADAEVAFASFKHLILLRIKPYRETTTRYLVFNRRTQSVTRIDEIGHSCRQLPEDHGLVFAGGYYLESGDYKRFAELGHDFSGYKLKRQVRAPNGEDVLYVFYEDQAGRYALLTYNLIARAMAPPLLAEGYARMSDGRLLVSTPESGEPTRVHIVQLWQSPFADLEHAAAQTRSDGLMGKLGNATLVRAIAELKQLSDVAESVRGERDFERLIRMAGKCLDAYPFLAEAELGSIDGAIKAVGETGRSALDAYDQLERSRKAARASVQREELTTSELLSKIASLLWNKPEDFVLAIAQIKRKLGEVERVAGEPHVDAAAIVTIKQRLADELGRTGLRAMKYFADPRAFQALSEGLGKIEAETTHAESSSKLKPIEHQLDELSISLDGLSELIGSFEDTDAKERAELLAATGKLFGRVNRARANLRARREILVESETEVEFSAQLAVLEESSSSLLARAADPQAIEDALAVAISQVEQLETRFGASSKFVQALTTRREMLLEAFEARRESLTLQQKARVNALADSVRRVLDGLPRRLAKLSEPEAIFALFAGDPLIARAQTQIKELRALSEPVQADEFDSRLRGLRDSALRDLRDRQELGDGQFIALGNKRFTVERRALDVAVVQDAQGLHTVLTGTDYKRRLPFDDAEQFAAVREQTLPSENAQVYRGEFLAWQLLLHPDLPPVTAGIDALAPWVTSQAGARQVEDYQRGVHDADAAAILLVLRQLSAQAGSLALAAPLRLAAQVVLAGWQGSVLESARVQGQTLAWLAHTHGPQIMARTVPEAWIKVIQDAARDVLGESLSLEQALGAALHLAQALAQPDLHLPVEAGAADLAEAWLHAAPRAVASSLADDRLALPERYALARAALEHLPADAMANAAANLAENPVSSPPQGATPLAAAGATAGLLPSGATGSPEQRMEAALMLILPGLKRVRMNVSVRAKVSGLLGTHARIRGGELLLDLPEFGQRLGDFCARLLPKFRDYARRKQALAASERARLRLDQFKAKPLAGFVRNRLIDEVYLPLIGNNLAKQIGVVDDARSDRSGLLLLISPPGYGKTTLMEYLADRLGMIFVRINGPTLGDLVRGLDPAVAPHKAAREELEKLSLGLAMGSNVMLYVDDIQHTSAEFLQSFISLADGTRRVDAVVDGEARSIDLRGKRFAIVMAGNPYTQAGQAFKIPDMLANRADTYNLGDVLNGRERLFADSYLENTLSANPLTAPLVERGRAAIDRALKAALDPDAPLPEGLPRASEAIAVLKRAVQARDVLMRVNSAYVESAAQDDAYRSEPAFKLQGSYRNMIKLMAQLNPLQSAAELDALIRDHYRGEAQTLAARAEENLLRLAHLIGDPSAEEQARWAQIVQDFRRMQAQGGKDADGSTRIAQVLGGISVALQQQTERETDSQQRIASALHQQGEREQQGQARIAVAVGDLASRIENAPGWAGLQSALAELARVGQTGPALEAVAKALAGQLQQTQRVVAAIAQSFSALKDVAERPQQLVAPTELEASLKSMARAYEETLVPLVSALHHKMTLDHSLWESVRSIRTDLDEVFKRNAARRAPPKAGTDKA